MRVERGSNQVQKSRETESEKKKWNERDDAGTTACKNMKGKEEKGGRIQTRTIYRHAQPIHRVLIYCVARFTISFAHRTVVFRSRERPFTFSALVIQSASK